MFIKIKHSIKKFIYTIVPPPNLSIIVDEKFSNFSYAQAGEDMILRYLFNDKKIREITYLDLGTNHPISHNNTIWFYNQGHKGVCIEANKTLSPILKQMRPNDVIINAAVAAKSCKEADFYIFDSHAISTLNPKEADKRKFQ